MILKDKILAELNDIEPIQLHLIYDLIHNLKKTSAAKPVDQIPNKAHLITRSALKGLKSSLSDEIIEARKDRI